MEGFVIWCGVHMTYEFFARAHGKKTKTTNTYIDILLASAPYYKALPIRLIIRLVSGLLTYTVNHNATIFA